MMTSSYLAYSAGGISVLLHLLLFLLDTRRSYRYYNASLLLWISGNFVWMCTELVAAEPSSNIHFGPRTPTGGIPASDIKQMIQAKSVLFFIAAAVQVVMYIGIHCKVIAMPEDDEEDIVSQNEAMLLCNRWRGAPSRGASVSSGASPAPPLAVLPEAGIDELDDFSVNPHQGRMSLVYIENIYILCWICKDISWSWGTGDVTPHPDKPTIFSFEVLGLLFGTAALANYIVVSYLHRRNMVRLFDGITTLFWVAANFVWMAGESVYS